MGGSVWVVAGTFLVLAVTVMWTSKKVWVWIDF
jgi:hypothetical protein